MKWGNSRSKKSITGILVSLLLSLYAQQPGLAADDPKMSQQLQDLFNKYAAIAWLKQLVLADAISSSENFQLDLDAGTITFSEAHPAMLLGDESNKTKTWLWGWANDKTKYGEKVLKASQELKDYGSKNGVPELSSGNLPLTTVDGTHIAMVASGLLKAGSYLGMPFTVKDDKQVVAMSDDEPFGQSFILLPDYPVLNDSQKSASRIVDAMKGLIDTYEVDHKKALMGLVEGLQLKSEEKDGAVKVTSPDGSVSTFKFDAKGKLDDMDVEDKK
ncbi:MAG: hypothetical protein K2Z81_18995 [Cyanobacteria bacterium]|nr:hypothetical protein [Cyanobacteriota bacterium]